MKKNFIKAEEFDRRFDNGEDISEFLDVKHAKKFTRNQERVSVDFPLWLVRSLDEEAKRLGVTRQSIINIWIAERLKSIA